VVNPAKSWQNICFRREIEKFVDNPKGKTHGNTQKEREIKLLTDVRYRREGMLRRLT